MFFCCRWERSRASQFSDVDSSPSAASSCSSRSSEPRTAPSAHADSYSTWTALLSLLSALPATWLHAITTADLEAHLNIPVGVLACLGHVGLSAQSISTAPEPSWESLVRCQNRLFNKWKNKRCPCLGWSSAVLLCPVETFNQDEFIPHMRRSIKGYPCLFVFSLSSTLDSLRQANSVSSWWRVRVESNSFYFPFLWWTVWDCMYCYSLLSLQGVLFFESICHDKTRAGCGCLCVQPCTILSKQAHCGRLQPRLPV